MQINKFTQGQVGQLQQRLNKMQEKAAAAKDPETKEALLAVRGCWGWGWGWVGGWLSGRRLWVGGRVGGGCGWVGGWVCEWEAAVGGWAGGSRRGPHARPHAHTPLLPLLLQEGKEIGDEFLQLEKYVNLNYMGFHKILKKHDKMLPHAPCRQFYITHLHAQPWVQVRGELCGGWGGGGGVRDARVDVCHARPPPPPALLSGQLL